MDKHVLTLEVGSFIYRACCMEEVRLAPGRIAKMLIVKLNIERDTVLLRRVWDDGGLCKPERRAASWLVDAGWRNTPQEAAEAGVVYLRRQIDDAKNTIATAESVLAVLTQNGLVIPSRLQRYALRCRFATKAER